MYIAIKDNKINLVSSERPGEQMGDIIFLENTEEVFEKMQFFKIKSYSKNSIIFSQTFIGGEEINYIEKTLRSSLQRYNELRELGEMRSNTEEQEFQLMETKKTQLMTRRKQLLDNQA